MDNIEMNTLATSLLINGEFGTPLYGSALKTKEKYLRVKGLVEDTPTRQLLSHIFVDYVISNNEMLFKYYIRKYVRSAKCVDDVLDLRLANMIYKEKREVTYN